MSKHDILITARNQSQKRGNAASSVACRIKTADTQHNIKQLVTTLTQGLGPFSKEQPSGRRVNPKNFGRVVCVTS